jgi:trans-aconitate methyltransferase
MDNSPDRWAHYYEYAAAGRTLRDLFVSAMERWSGPPGVALDLGCGDGTETLALLEAGWTVHAVDSSPEGIERTTGLASAHADRLTTHLVRLEDFSPPAVDLLYSGWTLPFCHPDHFDALWARLRAALNPGGLLAVNLFGVRDDWTNEADMTFRTLQEAHDMAEGLTDLVLVESEEDGQSFVGPKHWHELEISGRREL